MSKSNKNYIPFWQIDNWYSFTLTLTYSIQLIVEAHVWWHLHFDLFGFRIYDWINRMIQFDSFKLIYYIRFSWIVCFNFTGPIIVVVVGVSFVVVVQVVHCSLFIAISNDSMMLTQRKNELKFLLLCFCNTMEGIKWLDKTTIMNQGF